MSHLGHADMKSIILNSNLIEYPMTSFAKSGNSIHKGSILSQMSL